MVEGTGNGWDKHKMYVEHELDRHSKWLASIDGHVNDLRTELAGFKGRLYGAAAVISLAVTIVIKLLWP